ncbi:MAG: SUMF1/EgtB/PvdO family nonheme iron enzyme [Bacteroidales bacterium]|jgi:formylglycine-generating enzyme required for sulfatase activity|nr:SUMF1/EgtB/PvdO family nonheme iron enzyme [Bacteroidales bacterium]
MNTIKKVMTGMLMIAAVTAVMISCKKDAPAPALSITPQQSAVVFKADGGNATFAVTTHQSTWNVTASTGQTWCTVAKTATGFTVSATANTAFTAPAPATVTVTAAGAAAIVIEVTQSGVTGFTETGVTGVSFEMVAVAGGTFTMGAADDDPDAYTPEKPAHEVTLSDFYIGRFEVTQALWLAVTGSWPGTAPSSGYGLGDNYPAYNVSWNNIQTFITTLNQQTGKNYRLPTEAEWEYAARGGAQSGGYRYSGSNTVGGVAWYSSNSIGKLHEVGTKASNKLGIFDMSGNVWEWCSDWYSSSYYTSVAQTNPTGPVNGSNRVRRGGSWGSLARYCRVSFRSDDSPGNSDSYLGFRLARSSN